ncbi:hypothetical protein RIF29_16853 [Crotalaria pallida]|uniref:Phenolic glucoside malonyltransferase 1-like n=1 Tax=Crotalaria pallida TaxID=3830 RepID=A0AAN9FJK1_CROPI
MASPNSSIKIHEHCHIAPPPTAAPSSHPLTFFDLAWLRFHPVERTFFYSFPFPHANNPSFFFEKVIPNLKTSLSLTLQHFLLLAGNIVWPSDSETPILQYTPGKDVGVSLLIAESEADFNHIVDNSPHEAADSRSFVPHLESFDTHASIISLQITHFPNKGFSIGISTHHAVLDGKSSTMFIKAWASLCHHQVVDEESQSSPSLVPELEPFLDREVIKDPTGLGLFFTKIWTEKLSKLFPTEQNSGRTLKILPFPPQLEDSVRATFEITREDLEKIKKRVLSKWDDIDIAMNNEIPSYSKPHTLSSFVLTCAYVSVCIAKAIQGVESNKQKFVFSFTTDCRGRLEEPVPNNYFGNCVWGEFVDTQPTDYIHEEGVVIVAKNIHNKIKKMLEKGVLEGVSDMFSTYASLQSEGIERIGIAGSNRFGVYGIDFGWGKPAKVEIPSIDRGLTFGIADSKDGKGGIEVGLVLNKHVMDIFKTLFNAGLCID